MYVQAFEIKNFRSLANVKVTDLPPLVVLFGHTSHILSPEEMPKRVDSSDSKAVK